MKATLMASAAAAALMAASPAYAVHEITLNVFDNGVLIGSTSDTDGSANLTLVNDPAFSRIVIGAAGSPILPNGDLSSITLAASAASITGTHTLTVDALQTGINSGAGSTNSTFTVNNLVGTPGPTTESTYIGGTETALGTQVASHTFAEGTVVESFGPVTASTPAFTSDAQQYQIVFNASGESANDTIQFTGTAAIPEPRTWAMMSLGFIALGWFGWKRKSATSARFAF